MPKNKVILWLCACLALPLAAGPAETQLPSGDGLAQKIDLVMSEVYKPGEPGAAILVRKDGRTIFRKGYGLADLELRVEVKPGMIFRLGSITKQFTAVSVLMLAEQGRLSLQDEITKFLPDYPTQGRTITVEHLLTHTSGIQSYTDMAEWLPLWRKDFTLAGLIDLFKDKPMGFEPGTRWAYNNSGYILLGAIIEKASGLTYEDFVWKRIFEPLGMTHSSYDHTERVVPGRVRGYQMDGGAFINAPYLSMSQPYAAGSLMSSVDDLAIWSEAVFSGRLLKKEWLDRAFTPYRLEGGESSGYGYGWFIADFEGHRSIEHGGGINGFTSYEMTLPDDGMFLAILTNSAAAGRDPEPRAVKIARLVLGLPEPERKPVKLTEGEMTAIQGVYQNEIGQILNVFAEGGKLFAQRAGGAKHDLLAASPLDLFLADRPTRLLVGKNAAGNVESLRAVERIGPVQVFRKTGKALPAQREEVSVDSAVYDAYIGDYELSPGFIITVLKRDGRLFSQATGQQEVELFPESETRFFLKVVDAQVEFVKDPAGRVTGLVLDQGGRKMPAKKIRTP